MLSMLPFSVGHENGKYNLSIAQYSGDAGDSMSRQNGMKFSTIDLDNDFWHGNCADRYRAGWWYEQCHNSNLNGLYKDSSYGKGVNWRTWRGYRYSLKFTEMKIRPQV